MTNQGTKSQEIRLLGEGISRGIAVGDPFFFSHLEPAIPDYAVSVSNRRREVRRFDDAVQKTREDVLRLRDQLQVEGAVEAADILDAQVQFFSDPMINSDIAEGIKTEGRNAEAIFQKIWQRYQAQFETMTDPYFRERFADFEDLYRRIMRHMLGAKEPTLTDAPSHSIVFAMELSPCHTASVQACNIGAFVTEKGGATSHAAIVARAKGIPYVANLDLSRVPKKLNGPVIVDGRTGVVILNPKRETLERYQAMSDKLEEVQRVFQEQAQLPAETLDGYVLKLSANLDDVNELPFLHEHNGDGIGLFRSEYLFLSRSGFPSEQEQFQAYRTIIERMHGMPVVIRAFDVGGDKHSVEQPTWKELNPYLGCRAIRLLLRKPEIFRTQLRAVLRASALGNVSLLFPMVTHLHELREVRSIIDEVKQKLIKEGHQIPENLGIGSMIEVPSAALIADLLTEECDFLSIGTNDLVQYALAVDRSNDTMAGHYTPMHPGILRLLKYIVTQAEQKGVPVSLCGEMAADPRLTSFLIGLGLKELSVSTRHIPLIKHVIRRTSVVEARKLTDQVLTMTDPGEILSLLASEYRRTIPEDILFNP